MSTEHRLIEIEIKMGHQEDLLESLNRTVYQQQVQIDKLEKLCSVLLTQMRELADRQAAGGQERPPHY